MKTITLSLFLLISLNAQTIWYIDRDASGSANGTSWANAWKNFDKINWASISSGDTIYVSGGTDSTTYVPTELPLNHNSQILLGKAFAPFYSFASGNPVVVARAWHPNHNGEVVITNISSEQTRLFVFCGISNVKVYGLKFFDRRTAFKGFMINIGGGDVGNIDSMQTFEKCEVYINGHNYGIYVIGYMITVKNCYIEVAENTYDDPHDAFGFSGGRGNYILDGNTIIWKGRSLTTDEHADIYQFSAFGNSAMDESVDIVLRNNLLVHAYDQTAWTGFMYSSNPRVNANFYIYNNIFASNNTASPVGGIFMYQPSSSWTFSAFIFNNTFLMNSNPAGQTIPINVGGTDSLILHNNLVIEVANVNYMMNTKPFRNDTPPYNYTPYYRKVDYNAWYKLGGLTDSFNSGELFGSFTYQQWRTYEYPWGQENYDANSIDGNSADVTFVNRFGYDRTDYYTETGRNLGMNIAETYPWIAAKFPDISNDALGNPRGANWDMGALEFQGGQSNTLNAKGKIFLQGPFNTNSMITNLSQNGLLPTTQPFNSAPWNYSGSESLGSGSTSSYVDWVLVELRNSSNPTQIVARKAALLKNDGTLLNTDGSNGVPFTNVQEGSYYIAVFHRNHLAAMSAAPVELSANSQVYDFTTGINKAYGTNPMANLGNGIFGMYAGDGNSNGGITITDRNEVWLPQNGTIGYLKGDFNLDGGVTTHDINLYWNINNGTMTQVP